MSQNFSCSNRRNLSNISIRITGPRMLKLNAKMSMEH